MTQKEIIEKFYVSQITKNDVIIQKDKNGEEYDRYIVNDGFDYWYYDGNGVISLNFLNKEDKYEYEIISLNQFKKMKDRMEKENRIKRLKQEIEDLQKQVREE